VEGSPLIEGGLPKVLEDEEKVTSREVTPGYHHPRPLSIDRKVRFHPDDDPKPRVSTSKHSFRNRPRVYLEVSLIRDANPHKPKRGSEDDGSLGIAKPRGSDKVRPKVPKPSLSCAFRKLNTEEIDLRVLKSGKGAKPLLKAAPRGQNGYSEDEESLVESCTVLRRMCWWEELEIQGLSSEEEPSGRRSNGGSEDEESSVESSVIPKRTCWRNEFPSSSLWKSKVGSENNRSDSVDGGKGVDDVTTSPTTWDRAEASSLTSDDAPSSSIFNTPPPSTPAEPLIPASLLAQLFPPLPELPPSPPEEPSDDDDAWLEEILKQCAQLNGNPKGDIIRKSSNEK
jgi:hypothetical protein